jgi:acyl-[acyl-carrier-protein]-phospholipid O-acyltransferase/long-chain-fatty-acid--[acyl-carrier-protein] ligase
VLVGSTLLFQQLKARLGADRPMIGVWLPPGAPAALANIALTFLGKAAVNLNYTSSPAVVQSSARQCNLRQVITSKRFVHKLPLEAGPDVELLFLEDLMAGISRVQKLRTFLRILLLPRFVTERWLLGLGTHKADDLLTVIFSSGSTGDPKGVMLANRNIAANVESIIQAIDPRPRDRLVGILPFFHSFGYTVTLWVPLQVGASVVFHADPRQSREIGELCRKHRGTIFLATPTFLRLCLRRCEPEDFKSLRFLWCGAEKLPPSLAKEFEEKFKVLPMEGYGCTELSPAAIANVPDRNLDGFRQVGNKPGTIGQPLPGVAAALVDPDTFAPLPVGKEGLLLVHGANVMMGYLGRPEATREVIRDGWYVTGDIARMDEEGFLTLTDRLSRFSKIGGEMVPHQKVEDEIHAILGTSERVCVVTAVPDESKGERLMVLHVGIDVKAVWQQLSTRGLPNLWLPRERDFLQIPELPILGSGKLDLKRCKEIALEAKQTSEKV